ncbi:hypothetical protein DPMN_082325 [Dreissena polymorpha]|uniref:Uncharacterized protein n=1 Tax=Dreissena polymorpha TaxID=45954 RepID=A0A9D4BIQ3_DREPO|nr:hypothetical protein DPMN_082325 [Dreissena polymorpha]
MAAARLCGYLGREGRRHAVSLGVASLYYNYNDYHSIFIMTLVDADYEFLWAKVGSNGSAGHV